MEQTLTVERIAFGGRGLARLPDGKICFVPGVIPGEKVRVRLRREKARLAEADLLEVVAASQDRLQPPCPVFGRCGGCQYQHIAYPRQLEIKREQVRETLRRLGGIENAPVRPTAPSPIEYGYRNRITVHAANGRIGFYREASRAVIDVAHCPISSPAVNAQLAALREAQPRDGQYPLREPGAHRGFRQVNAAAAEVLAGVVEELAVPGGRLLVDLYSGAGFFSKRLRHLFARVIGIEWSADSVRAARKDAAESETYLEGDVRRRLPEVLAGAPLAETTVIVDPPAEGLAAEAVAQLGAHRPGRLLYVSCDPATLARDLRRLGGGYRLQAVCPVDMFPQTAEIETVVLLEATRNPAA